MGETLGVGEVKVVFRIVIGGVFGIPALVMVNIQSHPVHHVVPVARQHPYHFPSVWKQLLWEQIHHFYFEFGVCQ
jgi:hypothetical protein